MAPSILLPWVREFVVAWLDLLLVVVQLLVLLTPLDVGSLE